MSIGGFYIQFIKANQPSLMEAIAVRLTGTDAEFADTTWTQEGKGHGRREKRAIRTAPAAGIDWPAAQQVFRIRRDAGPTHGPWESKETALGITNLAAGLAGPQHIATYARRHWAVENEEHYVRDVTFREDAQKTRTGSQPNAHAGIRNLVTGAFRKKGARQHRRRPPLLRPRRPAHPRPVRIRLKPAVEAKPSSNTNLPGPYYPRPRGFLRRSAP